MSAVQVVEDHVDKLEKDYGIPRSKIVVGGFSQGMKGRDTYRQSHVRSA